jgi:hypothetical protein
MATQTQIDQLKAKFAAEIAQLESTVSKDVVKEEAKVNELLPINILEEACKKLQGLMKEKLVQMGQPSTLFDYPVKGSGKMKVLSIEPLKIYQKVVATSQNGQPYLKDDFTKLLSHTNTIVIKYAGQHITSRNGSFYSEPKTWNLGQVHMVEGVATLVPFRQTEASQKHHELSKFLQGFVSDFSAAQ